MKTIWKEYDEKIEANKTISEKIIRSMIKDRSRSRLAKMRRDYILQFVFFCAITMFCMACIIWNAFDYRYTLSYVPLVITTICLIIFQVLIVKQYRNSSKDLNNDNLLTSLQKIIFLHDRYMALGGKTGLFFMIAGALFPVARLPNLLETRGLMESIGISFIPVAFTIIAFFTARKLGAFKDRYGDRLKEDLKELEELNQL